MDELMAAIRDQRHAEWDVPDGYHLVAVPTSSIESAGHWQLAEGKRCRAGASRGRKACGDPSIAELNRGTDQYPAWWAYCPSHLYGQWVEDDQLMRWILAADD